MSISSELNAVTRRILRLVMIIVLLATFLLGLLLGSFLNVCISRLPQGESVVSPRSHCRACGAQIRWHDNIPLFSWLILRGSCRDCKQPVSWRYPLVELAFGVWLTWVVSHCERLALNGTYAQLSTDAYFNLILSGIGLAILGFLLIGLTVMDWQTMRLPDAFTLTGIFIAMLLICTQAIFLGPTEDQVNLGQHHLRLSSPGAVKDSGNLFLTGPENLIFSRIAAIVGTALLLLSVRWLYKLARHRDGLGLGDVKLLAMIAAFLGFMPAILALFVGALAASLYGSVLVARGRATGQSKLAFGSFLCTGGLLSALFGNRLIDMYMGLLR